MPKPPVRKARQQSSNQWLWIGLAAIVLVALIAAVVVSAGGGDDDVVADGVEQVRPVEVEGDALPDYPGGGQDAGVGQVAPEVRGADFDGEPVEITRDGRGKLVVFLAHWCSHCQAEVPVIVEHLASGYELPDNVDLVGVSTAVDERQPNFPPSAWLDDEGWTVPTIVDDADGAAADGFGLTGFPYLVGLDPDGRLVGRVSGQFPMEVLEALATAASGG